MPIILFLNLKGGVAKTTTAVAVAECLAEMGKRTLLIDADHQCTAGLLVLGKDGMKSVESGRSTLHDLLAAMLEDRFAIDDTNRFIVPKASRVVPLTDKLSVLPCSPRIDEFELNMARARKPIASDEFQKVWSSRRASLRKWLRPRFDFTIVDCPPSIAHHVRFMLALADGYVVPSIPDALSLRGSQELIRRVTAGYKATKPLGTVWTLYREQNEIHRRVVDAKIRSSDLPTPFKTIIPNATDIARATEPQSAHKSLSAKYSPKFAAIFKSLAAEVVARSNQRFGLKL